MSHPFHRGAFTRAVIAALCLFTVFAFAFAPHAHAEGRHIHHRHHHRVWHHYYRRHVERDRFGVEAVVAGASDVLREAGRFIGDRNITGHRGPWCKFFVNLILERTGHHWDASGRARDAGLLGPRTFAHPGAIAFTPHHTGFVALVDRAHERVLLLGGNQNHHRVSLSWHSMRGMRFVQPV